MQAWLLTLLVLTGKPDVAMIFMAHEALARARMTSYTYHQRYELTQFDTQGNPIGYFQREWDIVYDDSGKPIVQSKPTHSEVNTLKHGVMAYTSFPKWLQPKADWDDFLTDRDLAGYRVGYSRLGILSGHEDYVFDVSPPHYQHHRTYFRGEVWVNPDTLDVERLAGRTVPDLDWHGWLGRRVEARFAPFVEDRIMVDGVSFPKTNVEAGVWNFDIFPPGPVRVRATMTWSNYHRFTSECRVLAFQRALDDRAPQGPKRNLRTGTEADDRRREGRRHKGQDHMDGR